MQVATTTTSVDRDPIQLLCAPRIEAKIWVKLLQLPSVFSFDEAFLLCQVSFDEWLAWIPDYGEARLHVSQFECLA